ncbi:thioredoxin family protein [Burkholderia anthina]|uniref:thioredoxin family protein n=1 Tax=Burkholderia anthina TaxID=179879 RepID=UPI001CF2206B|nr:thioredoxin family protein [Burkholderia anthina]MCA8095238.1 thioredoxin family protein [Burkholderia anthina]
MTIVDTTPETFDADIRDELPVLVDFWAPWCEPCRALMPSVDRLAAAYEGRLKVLKLNIDEAENAWQRFNVRGIPALVFYREGQEIGRCIGPSTIRLRTMVEKWLDEAGLDVPLRIDEPLVQPAGAAGRPERIWHSFDGSEDIKAACVARWRAAPPTQRSRPLSVLSGEGQSEQFEGTLGVPAGLGYLLNMLWELAAGLEDSIDEAPQAHAQLTEWIEALPVGVDLSAVTAAVLRDFMCASPWKISRHFDGAAHELANRIELLHARENARGTVSASEWEGLQREAVLLIGTGSKKEERISEHLESLAYSLNHESAYREVFGILELIVGEFQRSGNWTDAEESQIRQIKEEDGSRAVSELGKPPSLEDESAFYAWHDRYLGRVKALNRRSRAEFPALWLRHDAVAAYRKTSGQQIAAYLADRLRTHARAAGAASS